MAIKYFDAEDVKQIAEELINELSWGHIPLEHVAFLRSTGSSSRYTIARCHALGKAMQIGMGRKKGFYLVEVISEKYDKLSKEDQIKTIIHELMHIPKSFGGGFIHHNHVHEENVNKVYSNYCNLKEKRLISSIPKEDFTSPYYSETNTLTSTTPELKEKKYKWF